jgi:hypothetical protein
VIAFTSVAANLIAISGGILVFHDSIGAGATQIIRTDARVLPGHRRRCADARTDARTADQRRAGGHPTQPSPLARLAPAGPRTTDERQPPSLT